LGKEDGEGGVNKATLYIDLEEAKKAEAKAKKEIDPAMSLSALVRMLIKRYLTTSNGDKASREKRP
jgi:hypothetical protein